MKARTGYTTGSCATAAAKAAAIGLFRGNIPQEVYIDTPAHIKLMLNICDKFMSAYATECAVQKDAGDDPDVTHGCYVYARAERNNSNRIIIEGGEGVGTVTKRGLQAEAGNPAINPVPRRMIEDEVRRIIGYDSGARIVISVPGGKKLAEKTCNPRLGIVGGISIIGTTGIVRPMSDDAMKASLLCGFDVAKGTGYETVILVPGNLGERGIKKLSGVQNDQIVQMSNFVGFMLNAAKERAFANVLLAGHPGKLAKLIRGDFNTHSSVAPPANDIVWGIIAKNRTSPSLPNTLKHSATVEGMVEFLKKEDNLLLMDKVAEEIEEKVRVFIQHKLGVGVVLFDMNGSMVGASVYARKWLRNKKTIS